MQDVSADIFGRQIQAIQIRFDALKHSARGTPDQQHDVLLRTFEEFSTSLEELSVAENELRIQNEELLETRAEVEAERQKYRDLFDFAPDGYLVTDVAGTIREANRAAAAMLGAEQKHLAPKPLVVFMPDDVRPTFRRFLTEIAAADGPRDWEGKFRPRVGEHFFCSMTASPIRDADGTVTGLRWLLRDSTARKRAEAQIQRLNADLEQRVVDRTAELAGAVHLRDDLIERERQARERAEQAQGDLQFIGQAGATLTEQFDQDSALANVARLIVGNIADW